MSRGGTATLTFDHFMELLRDKIESLNVELARRDVIEFLRDKDSVAV